jgi:hypothetical protein
MVQFFVQCPQHPSIFTLDLSYAECTGNYIYHLVEEEYCLPKDSFTLTSLDLSNRISATSTTPITIQEGSSYIIKLGLSGGIDFQHREGGKTGSGGQLSEAQAALERKERLRKLALETIDITKDPYFLRNHLGTFECKLCLTLHPNEVSTHSDSHSDNSDSVVLPQ